MANITFTGIASGLDTDSMVQAMLMNYQNKIDKAQKDKAQLEYKQQAWNSMSEKLDKFRSIVDKMRFPGNYSATKAITSSSAVTINSKGTTTKGTHTIEVTSLATSANVSGKIDKSNLSSGASLSKGTKLTDLGMKVGDKITLNGKEINVETDDTLSTLESKLKSVDPNLTVNIDANNGAIFVSSKVTGSDGKIELGGDADALSKLGLTAGTTTGKNAEYTYNGMALSSSSNTVEVNGINMTLNEVTTSPVKVEVVSDTEPIVTMVKEFVDAYNELLGEIDKKYDAVSTGLKPLTEAQKEDMTASEIEKYEEKLKEEALRRDPTLKTIRDNLRNSLQGFVESNKEFKDLASIGITTGPWSEKGKLHLDEKKLAEALEKNVDEVIAVFTQKTTTVNGKTSGGVMDQMNTAYESMKKRVHSVKTYGTYHNDVIMKDNIKSAQSAITKAKQKYEAMRKIYQAKFTAMEKAISSLNSQGSTLGSWFQA